MNILEWHTIKSDGVFNELNASKNGLSSEEAKLRLEKYGYNTIQIEKKISVLDLFLSQFKNLIVLILIIAAIVSGVLGYVQHEDEYFFDAILIITIVIANAVFGFVQEYKAEKSIEALKKMSAPLATLLRNGEEVQLKASEVVPGDIVILREGDVVPSDARIIEAISCYVDESALTGESVPAHKEAGEVESTAQLADRCNMLYMNTAITRGKATAIIVTTGMNTEIGKIAKEIASVEEEKSHFEIEVEDLGKKIAIGVFAIVVIVAGTEFLLRNGDPVIIFLIAVSLAVAAIPEGLPAIVTLALAMGTRKMLHQNVLMRRLATVQNLGSVDLICTDKTGTLTENKMTVTKIYHQDNIVDITGKGFDIKGNFSINGNAASLKEFELLLTCAALCNDAKKTSSGFKGDPTEIAVLVPTYKAGYDVEKEILTYKRVDEVPFSSERKMMATINEMETGHVLFAKGAPEIVLDKCDYIYEKGKIKKLDDTTKKKITEAYEKMASEALRVLAFAYREVKLSDYDDAEQLEEKLVFLGLMGMIDPPREGVKEAIASCRSAGIRVVMITGDNHLTASAIGKELGFSGKSIAMEELDKLSDKELREIVEKIDIYARTSPAHKVNILKALKENGHIVAMTGDGVNDAAALKNSDVGIAMGIRGTEVTKEASHMVLLDDNFISIRNAIAHGRAIFDNIRKFVAYLLAANSTEVMVIFFASLFGFGLPLAAVHLLWINLLTDGLPALALGIDPPAKDIMKRKPRPKEERIIDNRMVMFILAIGISATIVILSMFHMVEFKDLVEAQTLVFTAFVLFEMGKVYLTRWYYKVDLFTNKWLHVAVLTSILLQLAVIYTPLSQYFRVKALDSNDWTIIGVGFVVFMVLSIVLLKIGENITKKELYSTS